MKKPLITIVPERHEVFVKGTRVNLTPKEYAILLFVKGKNVTVKRDDIIKSVWGIDREVGIESRSIDQHISRLRKKLGVDFIRTVPTHGYVWLGA